MHDRKYNLDISHLSSQIREDVVSIFQWLDKNVVQTTHIGRTTLGLAADVETTTDKIVQILNYLEYPYADFTKEHYIAHIATMLGRTVELVPMDLSRALSGACVRQFHMDHIFYNQKRHPVLQDHIVLHESAHLLLNHRLRKVTFPALAESVGDMPNQSRVRFRSQLIFRDLEQKMGEIEREQEKQAETFARLFMARIELQRRHRNLVRTQNINLFPPFSDES